MKRIKSISLSLFLGYFVSGGYMIACTSSPGRLYAAPFAVLGSIGVVGQTVNIQKTLEGFGVQPLVFRGGRDKAPVGLLGEITEEGLAKVQDMVDSTHRAFKRHVVESRPAMRSTIDEVATGMCQKGVRFFHSFFRSLHIIICYFLSAQEKPGLATMHLM
jgi:ClpP class serine protease